MAESQDADLRHSILMGSEVEYDFTCHPCSSGGRNMEASGYCMDCGVYLCGQCIKYHTTLPALAHHEVLDKDKMPTKRGAPPAKVICTERCQVHKDKVIEYFCPVHNFLGCSACITLKHAMCKDVEYIPEAAAGLENKTDYKTFKKRLDDLIQKSKDTIKYGQDSLKGARDNYSKVLQDIEAYQQEINKTLERIKHEIKEQAVQTRDKDIGLVNSVTDEGGNVLKELEKMSNEIKEDLNKKNYSKMFLQMKNTGKKLTELEERLAQLDKPFLTVYEFKRNLELQKMLKRNDGFGTLLFRTPGEIHASRTTHGERKGVPRIPGRPLVTNATHVTDISVKSVHNKSTCRISGAILLSSNHLVVTDEINTSVKLVDIDNKTILSEMKPEEPPYQVTKVDDEHLAVTIPEANSILLLRYDKAKGLVVDREIKVTARCRGIAYILDKLVVSFCDPAEVRVLSMSGDVLQTFATDSQGNQLFTNPTAVTASSYSQCIYVSDWRQRTMTMLDMNGTVKAVYKDRALSTPREVAVDPTGQVYVCGEDSHNIHLLTADCKKVKVLLRESDGLRYPFSICYCEATHRLYVGMYRSDIVKVYKLT